jgi:hypothetical protein
MIDILLTGVCTLGLALVAWVLFGRLTRPLPGQPVHLLVPGQGDGGALEQTVRALIWLRGLGLLRCPIVIADVDLTPWGWELAVRLTARWPDVVLWPADRLPEYLEMQDEGPTGT